MNSKLQELFARRLGEEMEAQRLSIHTVVRIAKKLGYEIGKSSVARILRGEQDPTIEKIHVLTEVLGVPPWVLFMEAGQIEQRIVRPISQARQNVVQLPSPYKSPFRKREAPGSEKMRASPKKR